VYDGRVAEPVVRSQVTETDSVIRRKFSKTALKKNAMTVDPKVFSTLPFVEGRIIGIGSTPN